MDDRTEEVIKAAVEHYAAEQREMTDRICVAIAYVATAIEGISMDIEEIKRKYIGE